MIDKESIFKSAIKKQLDNQLLKIGYSKEEEYKGYIRYVCSKNHLKFVYEWNRGRSFYCQMRFDSKEWDNEYMLGDIIHKLEKKDKIYEPVFGIEFSKRIEEWVGEISNQISKHNFQEIGNNHVIIEELRREYNKRTKEYNQELQIFQTKKNADKAWATKDYKLFIKIMKEKTIELPKSYDKKLSIAEKKIKN